MLALDRSGLGLSDPASSDDPPTIDRWVEDIVAVLDATGDGVVDVLANSDTCLIALALAATHPDRVDRLTLPDPYVRLSRTADYPHGFDEQQLFDLREPVRSPGSRAVDTLALVAPSRAADDRFRSWWNRVGTRAASPSSAALLHRVINQADARNLVDHELPPTNIIVRRRCPTYDPGHRRWLANGPTNATLVENDDTDDLWWLGDLTPLLAALG